MSSESPAHVWKFYRLGGLDQVAIETAEDLLHLGELDQKLWVALSCPVKGLELDEKTLALIDSDGDGRIRVKELIESIAWAVPYLKDASLLLRGADGLHLAEINDATPQGRALLVSVKRVLTALGKPAAEGISLADVSDTGKIFAASKFNGDGILPADSAGNVETSAVIREILATQGADKDKGGQEGVGAARVAAFFTELGAYAAWAEQASQPELSVLAEGTAASCEAFLAVRAKIEDFFTRVRLATYEPKAALALNRVEADFVTLSLRELSAASTELAAFPIARIEAGALLPLAQGVNPAWAAPLAAFRDLVVLPLLGSPLASLSEAQWQDIKARLAPYLSWQAAKKGGSVEKLGLARARALLASRAQAELGLLLEQDKAIGEEFAAIASIERILRYKRDLRTLLQNFVNFFDLYSKDTYAVFQAGTLYLDSRSTELCIRVDGPSPLAAMSKMFIAYCACTRPGGATMNIAACFTQGDGDYLFVGRHGVFYDRQGRDWDAVITSLVDNPISIGQAFWSPYKKFLRMIEEQVAKRAAAADAEATGKLSTAAESAAHADKSKAAPAKKFDLAVVTGIGVAIGSIGTFVAGIFTEFIKLTWWKYPLVLVGLLLAISLPSMIIAWLKLRQRTLGPLLESNGWAVNGRVLINIPFGAALTEKAVLPATARKSLADPYQDETAGKARFWVWGILAAALAAGLGVSYWLQVWPFGTGLLGRFF